MKKSVVSAEQQSAKAGERIENGDKDKKKKRRGSRRSKNTSGNIRIIDRSWLVNT